MNFLASHAHPESIYNRKSEADALTAEMKGLNLAKHEAQQQAKKPKSLLTANGSKEQAAVVPLEEAEGPLLG